MLLALLIFGCQAAEFKAFDNKSKKNSNYQFLERKVDLNRLVAVIKQQRSSGWMLERIHKDISDFSSEEWDPKYLVRMYDTYYENPKYLTFLVKIKNGHFEIKTSTPDKLEKHSSRSIIILLALEYLAKHLDLPDAVLLITTHDNNISQEFPIPLLCFAKKRQEKGVLIPDHHALNGFRIREKKIDRKLEEKLDEASLEYPWSEKEALVFWRGATTGGLYDLTNWNTFPRSQLVLFSVQHPSLADAKFNTVDSPQTDKSVRSLLTKTQMVGSFVSIPKSLKYKYLVDVDGNTCTYPRCYWILRSNSVLFKHASANIQWFYDLLKPWENYIPIAEDFSDFEQHISWARNHDQEAKQIALNGRKCARENLDLESNFAYLYLLIEQISLLQKAKI